MSLVRSTIEFNTIWIEHNPMTFAEKLIKWIEEHPVEEWKHSFNLSGKAYVTFAVERIEQ